STASSTAAALAANEARLALAVGILRARRAECTEASPCAGVSARGRRSRGVLFVDPGIPRGTARLRRHRRRGARMLRLGRRLRRAGIVTLRRWCLSVGGGRATPRHGSERENEEYLSARRSHASGDSSNRASGEMEPRWTFVFAPPWAVHASEQA